MTPGSPSRRLILVGLGLLPVLAGCSATPSPRLFTLAPQPATSDGRFSGTISVKRVTVAKYLDRPQIVRYSNPYELSFSEFMLWGEGLSDMVTRVLVENLSVRLPGSQIYAASGPLTKAKVDVTLEVNIDNFEPDPAGTVVLVAQWVAYREGHNDQLRSEQIQVMPASGDTMGQVAAMSDALGQLANQIAGGLPASR